MNSDVIIGIAGLTLGISYFIQSLNLPKAFIGNPWAPIYFPLSLGVLMILCSAILLVESLRRRKKSEKFSARVPWFLIIGTMSIGSVYAVLFNRIGFIPSTIIFIGAMLFLVNGTRGWLLNIILTVCLTLSVWYCFEKVLYISMP
ncbi:MULTISPECIES: tripartite tricarboxylate transporter TctB family protein [Acetomicrobium]|jgi:putative tricarboxylic transport membrane protein|uniref:tripartite tricarboxylate transporter TctB family protein n=1 Tax=Acetomicrobium TaxID=49894 RepID=UPI0016BAB908|nr:tripartite tricarboxylate transporter TctB family protein [Acetomicrobium mobile]NLI42292.1 tripartite tricarboxylate transporter TctB family protein [Synergistaceae bacterium]